MDRTRCPNFRSQRQPEVVYIRDHDVPCTDVPTDLGRHKPYGASPRDEHVFSDEIERKGRVGCIAEGIEKGGNLIVDVIRNEKGVRGRQHHVLGKASCGMYSDAPRISTEMPSTC